MSGTYGSGGPLDPGMSNEGAVPAPSETACPARSDKQHCRHWYDGDACCACGDPPMTNEARAAQGMPVVPAPSDEAVNAVEEVLNDLLGEPDNEEAHADLADQILAAAAPIIRAEERAATLREVIEFLRDPSQPRGLHSLVAADQIAKHFNLGVEHE